MLGQLLYSPAGHAYAQHDQAGRYDCEHHVGCDTEGRTVLIDFEGAHRTYLVGRPEGHKWVFNPTNADDPKKGIMLSSHTVFSNNALQLSLHLYNRLDQQGSCVGVAHCLLLCFSHKQEGSYPLNSDPRRITFHLDLGIAAELYGVAMGRNVDWTHRLVRQGRAAKTICGKSETRDGKTVLKLQANTSVNSQNVTCQVEMSKADAFALAAHCVAYGRLLYPSMSDVAIQAMLRDVGGNSRACAELGTVVDPTADKSRTPAQAASKRSIASADVAKLGKVIWAIGNQKWGNMEIEALKRIQQIGDPAVLQGLINDANAGDFTRWDAYL